MIQNITYKNSNITFIGKKPKVAEHYKQIEPYLDGLIPLKEIEAKTGIRRERISSIIQIMQNKKYSEIRNSKIVSFFKEFNSIEKIQEITGLSLIHIKRILRHNGI